MPILLAIGAIVAVVAYASAAGASTSQQASRGYTGPLRVSISTLNATGGFTATGAPIFQDPSTGNIFIGNNDGTATLYQGTP